MGIAPYKTFTFDGVSSSAYGVYLTGEGVFNAPVRSVEMIAIPGRNGDYALDQGKFEDISVTYKIGMFDVNESNFADKVSAFRNWLCSKVGYVRLSDDYNPNEYRMAVYANGLELDHKFLIAGEATITFTCKPQRWLTSGETATAVANNGTLSNPTLFDASPLLEVIGYGNIDIGGQSIFISGSAPLGRILLIGEFNEQSTAITKQFNGNNLNTSDTFTLDSEFNIYYADSGGYWLTAIIEVATSGITAEYSTASSRIRATFGTLTFTKGTSSTHTGTAEYTIKAQRKNGGTIVSTTRTVTFTIAYDGDDTITESITGTITATGTVAQAYISATDTFGESTVSALGNPMYIDLDIGECWNEDSGTPVSVNNAVTLPSDLPVLPPGSTTFTYDNTITSFKVKPRWWKV